MSKRYYRPELDALRFIAFLGVSFGLYVYHNLYLAAFMLHSLPGAIYKVPHNWALGDLLALLATIGTAAMSYRYFEMPILRYKQRFEIVVTRAL